MSRPLKEKLQSLQCHFTWDFQIKDKVDTTHILATLAVRLEHGPFGNRGTYLALKAYLYHLEGHSKEALTILQEAEEVLQLEQPGTFSHQVLLAYGNYAWIYYHLINYDKVELYLSRIRAICQDLSSPEAYSAPIPEVYAQKGWSLLAMGFRNGALAKQCFQKAAELQGMSAELQEGLAFSVYASVTHSQKDEQVKRESQRLLEGLIRSQPQNYEAKVYLASVIRGKERERARHLANDVVENSLNPELLRLAAKVYKFSPSQAISTLKKAIALHGDFHLLHHNLGLCYLGLLDQVPEGQREKTMEDAIECFKRSLEVNPAFVFSRLQLAKLYGERSPHYEEEAYLAVMEELPKASNRCQQAFYLHWGEFLLHKRGQRQEALRAYKACWEVPAVYAEEQRQLQQRLRELAKVFQREGETEQEEAVNRLLHAMAAMQLGDRVRVAP